MRPTDPTDHPNTTASLRSLGEFGLIARLTHDLETRPDVILGVGDDAALLDLGPDALLVATCDSQIEGRHFIQGVSSPAEIGHKALAVNLSDIAAMGAEPLWALVSLLLPPTIAPETLDAIYHGMRALARRYGVALVGGNVATTSGPLTLDITLLGRVHPSQAIRRSGARPGDLILVTGPLGAAAAGVLTLQNHPASTTDLTTAREQARQAMAAPEPRVREGQALAATSLVTAMLDVSDGLAADLGRLCAASDVGALLDAAALPIAPAAQALAPHWARDPLDLALFGGEDYQLLFTIPGDQPTALAQAQAALRAVGASEARVIGRATEASAGLRLQRPTGAVTPLEPRGWDHLR